ncbi:MAG: hypothetical protein H6830_11640 [Planctomycetes bacterium]|nr:hypothetical protein [Planctomycetota bacterium]MCB9908828.1 hypothetical protein [Planctomycetota bacterium]MCB9912347.1 hypothetical protein [Planctomycetota bacterium]
MNRNRFALLPGLALALAGGAFAQGDDCSTASTLTGTGAFSYDTTGFTTSGFQVGSCGSFNLYNDGFFQWTAPAAGDYVFDTFGTSYDTMMMISLGTGCGATCVGFNDDFGSLQSQVTVLGLTASQQVLIQLGSYNSATSGPGALNVNTYVDPCSGVPDDGFEDNDTCATATVLAAGTYTGLHTVAGDSDFYSVTIPTAMVLNWTVTLDSNDVDYDIWDATCSTLIGTAYYSFAYTNTTGAPETLTIEAYNWTGATLNCSDYDIDVSFTPDPCASAPDDAFEDNDTCGTPTVLAAGAYPGLAVIGTDYDYFQVTIPAGNILTWGETFDSNDTTYDVYDGGCGTLLLVDQLFGFDYNNTTGAPLNLIVQAYQYPGAAQLCSNYDIDVSFTPDPCAAGVDDSFEENDDCSTAAPISDGTYTTLFASKSDPDHYSFCVADGDTVTVDMFFSQALADMDGFLWDASDVNCGTGFGSTELAYGFSATDNENFSWTNLTGGDVNCVLEVNVYPFSAGDCNNYDLAITGAGGCGGGSVGTTFCDPMNPNSTGASTHLAGNFGTGVGSDLHLEATSGPPTQFGYFLIGTAPSDPGIVVSQGRLCLAVSGGNVFGRYNVPGGSLNSVGLFDAGGVLQNLVSTSTVGSGFDVPSTVPISGSPTITAGSTWHFQLWHRENAGASNFSNGLSVTF